MGIFLWAKITPEISLRNKSGVENTSVLLSSIMKSRKQSFFRGAVLNDGPTQGPLG